MTDRAPGGAEDVEEALKGGNMVGATRVGDSVRRPSGAWTPTIQRLLAHLHQQGPNGVPEPRGVDERGQENLSDLPGTVPQYPLPGWVWTDEVLLEAVELMAQLHQATNDFDREGALGQLPTHEPAEVICHNDFAPYNMAFTDQRWSGVIDWDTASPEPRVWDLAYLAYRLVPLTAASNEDGPVSSLAERAQRLRLVCGTYGAVPTPAQVLRVAVDRLQGLADVTQARVDEGQENLRNHVVLYRDDASWIQKHAVELSAPAQ